jgi:hypothetical protein
MSKTHTKLQITEFQALSATTSCTVHWLCWRGKLTGEQSLLSKVLTETFTTSTIKIYSSVDVRIYSEQDFKLTTQSQHGARC